MSISRTSSTDSFKSFTSTASNPHRQTTASHPATNPPEQAPTSPIPTNEPVRFPPEEEAHLLAESTAHKTTANALFASRDFSTAVQTYDKALAALPNYLDYEVAVLKSNIAACHIKLSEWKEAIGAATSAAERLEALDPSPRKKRQGSDVAAKKAEAKARMGAKTRPEPLKRKVNEARGDGRGDEAAVEEIDDATDAAYARLEASGHTHTEVQRLRVKVLMRRAKARSQLQTWAELSGAEEDYRELLGMHGSVLAGMDRTSVEWEARALGPRVEEAKTKEMGEMVGKLKDLGNGLLKPFGLSTDMFNFVKDEKSGGYSMNINKGG